MLPLASFQTNEPFIRMWSAAKSTGLQFPVPRGKKNPDLKEPLISFFGKGNIACDNEHLIEIADSVMLAWIGTGMKI